MTLDQESRARIAENYQDIRGRISEAAARASRDPSEIILVGVTKAQPIGYVAVATEIGIIDIGENYVQECLQKRTHLTDQNIHWHFIGSLQRNKVRSIAPFVHLIHAIDSESLALQIDKEAGAVKRRIRILLEVNTSGETTKHGVRPPDALALAKNIIALNNVELCGLMTLAAESDDPEVVRPMFATLRETRDQIQSSLGVALPQLSMGMSGDFETAVEEGATMVRIGSALFGERNQ